jgi:hypothetical protein
MTALLNIWRRIRHELCGMFRGHSWEECPKCEKAYCRRCGITFRAWMALCGSKLP